MNFAMVGKRIVQSEAFKTAVGFCAAMLIKFVRRTSRFEVRRADIAQRFWTGDEPFIGATWHGQNLILPTFWHNWREMRILVSRHGDGEIVSKIMHFLGVGTIRGSGVPKGEERRSKYKGKGGAGALRAMVRALGENISVGMTADLPPGPARRAGDGIVMLARLSGCPIVPVAATTRARIQLNNWDKFTINLPFTKGALVWGEPIYVPRDADPETLEAARLSVENGLNAVAEEADRIVGRRPALEGEGARAP
jgi:lysophospholipid acyltransferase (LPLAT)-like uncharacterized protein